MSLVAFKNNHWLFMLSFFSFFIVFNFFIYFWGTRSSVLDNNLIFFMAVGVIPSLFFAGVVKYLVEKYIQKKKESFLKIK
jgi:hypothetical protein